MSTLAVLVCLASQSGSQIVSGEQLLDELGKLPTLSAWQMSKLPNDWREAGYEYPRDLLKVDRTLKHLAKQTTSYALFDAADLLSQVAEKGLNFPGRYLNDYPEYKQRWILDRQGSLSAKQRSAGGELCALYQLMFESQSDFCWDWRGERPKLIVVKIGKGLPLPDVLCIPMADKAPKRRSLPD